MLLYFTNGSKKFIGNMGHRSGKLDVETMWSFHLDHDRLVAGSGPGPSTNRSKSSQSLCECEICFSPTPTLTNGFYWGHQCSWTLTPANNIQVSIMQSDNRTGSNQA